MGREERREIIKKIQDLRRSKVLVYFVGDRPLLGAQISADSIRWMYDHLKSMNDNSKVDTIDFYLYSLGGALNTPWPIVNMLREYCDTLNVLVPYKAYSAATLTALGADTISMGRKGELGPIDPQMTRTGHGPIPNETISTEDVSSYVSFVKNSVGVTDQSALAELTKALVDKTGALGLGEINRVHSHVRDVAKKLLSQVKPALDTAEITKIIESLTERTHIHGHSIGRQEARQMGLRIEDMDRGLEQLCWSLYLEYENHLKLHSYTDPNDFLEGGKDEYSEDGAVIACIESENLHHEYSGTLVCRRIRQPGPQLNLTVSIPIQLPDGGQDSVQSGKATLEQIQQDVTDRIARQIAEQIKAQMPTIGLEQSLTKRMWRKI